MDGGLGVLRVFGSLGSLGNLGSLRNELAAATTRETLQIPAVRRTVDLKVKGHASVLLQDLLEGHRARGVSIDAGVATQLAKLSANNAAITPETKVDGERLELPRCSGQGCWARAVRL